MFAIQITIKTGKIYNYAQNRESGQNLGKVVKTAKK